MITVTINLNTMKVRVAGSRGRGKFGTLLKFVERTYRMPNGFAATSRRVTIRSTDGVYYTGQFRSGESTVTLKPRAA